MSEEILKSSALCVHGHFYQPPREDPLTGEIPQEKGAEPFHDWNEKIFAECYLPNLEAGNFSLMSYNVGPTLFTWLDQIYPQAVAMMIEADRQNVARYGVGNAIAQPYNHTILPLAMRIKSLKLPGESLILKKGMVVHLRECGCRKPRWIWMFWKLWLSKGLPLPSWHPGRERRKI
jgi:alpha-amylase/alpha-mannosidase (GH57 family)